jgi:hypothetical protein
MKRKKAFPKKDAAAIGAIQQLLCFYEIKNPITMKHSGFNIANHLYTLMINTF